MTDLLSVDIDSSFSSDADEIFVNYSYENIDDEVFIRSTVRKEGIDLSFRVQVKTVWM